jgi:hypothetical protein
MLALNIKIKDFIIAIVTLLTTTSCANTDLSLVQKHLELIKSNNLKEANLEYCRPTEKLWLHNLNSFKIISSISTPVSESTLPLYYTDVVIDIDTNQQIGFANTQYKLLQPRVRIVGSEKISIQVWRSDDFYQWYIQTDTRKLSSSLLNQKNQTSKPLTSSITRDEINKNDLCVYMPPDQLKR